MPTNRPAKKAAAKKAAPPKPDTASTPPPEPSGPTIMVGAGDDADPLAAFRDDAPDAGRYPSAPDAPPSADGDDQDPDAQDGPDAEPPGTIRLVTEEDQAAAHAQLLATWHDDTTSIGFLHRGGRCGCNYLARLAVEQLLPVQLEDEAVADEE